MALAIPFLLLDEVPLVLRISNAVAVSLLFLTRFAFSRHVGRPWRVGFSMVAVGNFLVVIAMALDG